ncbi:MAG TPA: RNA polymerase sigma-70 factor [Bacteroidales bacterium]|nr:RNA polymerase sigma-70 factor [Bacteroidales bacterium]
MSAESQQLFEQIKAGNEKAFEMLFKQYYTPLCFHARKYIEHQEEAEEIVQNTFVSLWEKRDRLVIATSVEAYLYRWVTNACLNFIKHQKIVLNYSKENTIYDDATDEASFEAVTTDELADKINKAIENLPPKRKEVFMLSRFEGLKYHQIADKLGISPKTVEVHISAALKALRNELRKYL